MRERPINTCGLACADQEQPRAALDANDLWIPCLHSQHPVESYRQLTRRGHFRHCLRFPVAALQLLPAKLRITTNLRLQTADSTLPAICAASTSSKRSMPLPCLLIPPASVFLRNFPRAESIPDNLATCLPRRNLLTSPMVSTKASAVFGPTPGCVRSSFDCEASR